MIVLAAVAAVGAGCGDRTGGEPSPTAGTTTSRVYSGTGLLYPKHLHQPPTNNN